MPLLARSCHVSKGHLARFQDGFKPAGSFWVPPPFLPRSRFALSEVGPLDSKPLSQSLWLFPLHCLCGRPSPQGLSGLFWPRSCPVAGASRLQLDCPRDSLCRVVWAPLCCRAVPAPTPWWLEASRGYPTATVGLLPAGRAGRKQGWGGQYREYFCNLLE